MERYNDTERTSLWVIAGRVVFTVALIACIWFIFSNSMAVATVSSGSSGRVLAWMRIILRRLGQPGLAEHLTMRIVRKLAHFCEYTLEGFLLMLCMRVYSRHPLRHITVPMLGGVLTAAGSGSFRFLWIFRGNISERTDGGRGIFHGDGFREDSYLSLG